MEVHHDLVIRGIPHDRVVKVNHVLFVALEEVNLDALDAPLAQRSNSNRRTSRYVKQSRGFSVTTLCGPPELYQSSTPTPLLFA